MELSPDPWSQEVLCRWASDRYFLPDVVRVDFDARYVEGCPTCGGDTFVEVSVLYGDKQWTRYEEDYATDLIASILKAAHEDLA